jgi:DNA-binding response OmpR family regulator
VSDAGKKKILVVEDEDNLRELVQSRLEKEGFDVVTAADGFQAVVKARQDQPDLVILDLMIPKMDGYTVCRLFKSSGMAQIPIIMFTARSSPDDVRRGLDTGADAYVCKPFESSVLLSKVTELLKIGEPAAKPKPAPANPE